MSRSKCDPDLNSIIAASPEEALKNFYERKAGTGKVDVLTIPAIPFVSRDCGASQEPCLILSQFDTGCDTSSCCGAGTIVAGGESATLGKVYFVDSHGVSFGLLGQSLTASVDAGTASFSQSVQTQNLFDLSLGGNTSGALQLISSGTAILYGGNNITLSQNGQSITISAPNSSGFTQTIQPGIQSISGGTTRVTTGELVFSNANGISFGIAGQTITGSVQTTSFSQSVQTQNLVDLSIEGNTDGVLALISSGTAILVGGDNITLSQSGQSIVISGPIPILPSPPLAVSAGTQSRSSGTVIFSNSNNVSFGMTNSSVITASASFSQTVQTQNVVDLSLSGNTSGTLALISSGTAILAGGNNITLSQNGQSVTVSGPNMLSVGMSTGGNSAGTSGFVSNQMVFVGGNFITLSQATGAGGATLSIVGPTIATPIALKSAGMSTLGNTSGNTGYATNRFNLVGGNNITLSGSTSAGGNMSITISGPNTIPAFSAGVSTGGNTSGATGLVSNRLVFVGSNQITLSESTNGGSATITIIGPIPSTVLNSFASAGISSGGNTLGDTGLAASTMVLVGGNGVTLSGATAGGVDGSPTDATITVSVNAFNLSLSGNTSGTATLMQNGTFYLAGGNNITLSQNGSSVTISAASQTVQTQNVVDISLSGNTTGTLTLISSGTAILAGGNNITLSQNGQSITISGPTLGSLNNDMALFGNTQTSQLGQNSVIVWPYHAYHPISVSRANVFASGSFSSSAGSSFAGEIDVHFGIYTKNGSTLSLSASGSTAHIFTYSSTNSSASVNGVRMLSIPITMALTPGDYWFAFMSSTNTTQNKWFTMSNLLNTYMGSFVGPFGVAGNASHQIIPGLGGFSVTSGAVPSAIGFSDIIGTTLGSLRLPVINFVNYTA